MIIWSLKYPHEVEITTRGRKGVEQVIVLEAAVLEDWITMFQKTQQQLEAYAIYCGRPTQLSLPF